MDIIRKERSIPFIVFGCGLAFGLSGMYAYYKTRKTLKKEIRSMSVTIETLRSEIEELKFASQRGTPQHNKYSPVKANHIRARFADIPDSHSDIDSGDDEFYDFADNDNTQELPQTSDTPELLAFISEVDSMFENPSVDKEDIYNKISDAIDEYGPLEKILYRQVKACNYLVSKAAKENNLELKKAFAYKTLDLATEALSKYPQSGECHKWFAIAVGGLGEFVSTKERIENGYLFKKHVDIARELNPNDPTIHHMLGRFCEQIASLSWIERKVASTLFAEVPQSTMEDAICHLEEAYKLRREWKENLLYLVKCNLAVKRQSEARKYLEEGLNMPIKGEDDELAQTQLLTLKSKHGL